jgi:hypothetical protein
MVTRVVEPAPHGSPFGKKGSEIREMAAGKGTGTGKARRPPLTGKYLTANITTLSTNVTSNCLVHKH